MTTLWILAVIALAVAMLAFAQSRRTARKLEQVTELYWQLKFDHGELKARVDPPEPPPTQARTTFVPLDRLTGRSGPAKPDGSGDAGSGGGA